MPLIKTVHEKHLINSANIMKTFFTKSLYYTIVVLAFYACSDNIENELTSKVEKKELRKTHTHQHRTYEEALIIAKNAAGMLDNNSNTRSNKSRTININSVQYIVNPSNSRSTESCDTLMYVFNYEDNSGFAIISANRATEELIAVTEQGSYDAGKSSGNKGFDLYMDMAKFYVNNAKNNETTVMPDTICELIKEESNRILYSYGPYINVRWGQDYPYNQFCITNTNDTIKAGCLTTALAQIISYYEYPTALTINYDGASSVLPLNWDIIKEHYSSDQCNCSEHLTIGKMFRQLGYELWIDYKNGYSGNSGAYIDDALSILGYTYGNRQSYNKDVVEASLSEGKVIYITGYLSSTGEGHAWIIDGFKKVETTIIEYSRNSVTGVLTEQWRETSQSYYNHFNWGWNGDSNGYYLCNVFDVRRYSELDSDVSSTATYNFTYNITMFPYIDH